LFENLSVNDNINFFVPDNDLIKHTNFKILNKKVNRLSGGEKQKVAIMRAMKSNPKVLFCDEPTGSLDKMSKKNVAKYLKEISKNILVIVITHEDFYFEKPDGVFCLKDKKINQVIQKKQRRAKKINQKRVLKNIINFKHKFRYSLNNLLSKFNRTMIAISAIGIGLFAIGVSLMIPEIVFYEIRNELISEFDNNKVLLKEENDADEFNELFSCSELEVKYLADKYIQDIDGYGTYYYSNFEEQFIDKNYLNLSVDEKEMTMPHITIRHINEYYLTEELPNYEFPDKSLDDDECYFMFTNKDVRRIIDFTGLNNETELRNYIHNKKINFVFLFSNESWNYEKKIHIECKDFVIGDNTRIIHTSKRWNETIFEKQMQLITDDNLVSNNILPWTLKKLFYLKCRDDDRVDVIKKLWNDSNNDSYIFDFINDENSKIIYRDGIKFSRILVAYQNESQINLGLINNYLLDKEIESLLFVNDRTYYVFNELLFNAFTSATFLFSTSQNMFDFIDEYTLCEENLNSLNNINNDKNIIYSNIACMAIDDSLKITSSKPKNLYGRIANEYSEIVISKKIADTLFSDFDYEEILMKELYFSCIKDYIFDGTTYENKFKNTSLKIVGIDLNNSKWNNLYVDQYWTSFFFSEELSYSLNELRPQKCLITLLDGTKEYFIKEYDKRPQSFILIDPLKNINNNISNILTYVNFGLLGFSSISIISAILMNMVIVYLFVKDLQKEIGLMRVVGVSKMDILSIFIMISLMIGVGAFLYSLLMLIVTIFVINKSILLDIIFLKPLIRATLIIFLVSVLLSLLIAVFSSINVLNKRPLKLINDNLN